MTAIMAKTVTEPIPTYKPPIDGKPIDAVDAKWMRLAQSSRHYMERRSKAVGEATDGAEHRYRA